MMELTKKTEDEVSEKYGRRISVWHGDPKYDTGYRMRIVKGKYLPKLLEDIQAEQFVKNIEEVKNL